MYAKKPLARLVIDLGKLGYRDYLHVASVSHSKSLGNDVLPQRMVMLVMIAVIEATYGTDDRQGMESLCQLSSSRDTLSIVSLEEGTNSHL
jgi:hypothetical protein